MCINCATLLADLFLYLYEAEFIQTLIKSGKQHLDKSCNSTYMHIDDVLSINNPQFGDYINIIYPRHNASMFEASTCCEIYVYMCIYVYTCMYMYNIFVFFICIWMHVCECKFMHVYLIMYLYSLRFLISAC